MTDQRFTTEEAERIAEWIDCYHGFGCGCANKAAADALRDLAAERDALLAERRGWIELSRQVLAALGENQP